MRDVLGRVSTGAAGRILDSANPREIRTKKKAVSIAAKTRGHSEHDEGAQVSQWKLREPVCQNTLKRQYASSPRKEERDYKGLWRAQAALPVWPAHQPCRSPGETSVRGPIVA